MILLRNLCLALLLLGNGAWAWVDTRARDALADLKAQHHQIKKELDQAVDRQATISQQQQDIFRALLALNQKAQELQDLLRTMSGQADVDRYGLNRLIEDQKRLAADLESRLKVLELKLQLWVDQQTSPPTPVRPAPVEPRANGVL